MTQFAGETLSTTFTGNGVDSDCAGVAAVTVGTACVALTVSTDCESANGSQSIFPGTLSPSVISVATLWWPSQSPGSSRNKPNNSLLHFEESADFGQ